MLRDALIEHLNHLLHPELFKDYAPNGLQVQGVSFRLMHFLCITDGFGAEKMQLLSAPNTKD